MKRSPFTRSSNPLLQERRNTARLTGVALIGLFASMAIVAKTNAQVVAPQLVLETVATGFDDPVDIDHAGDERLFITERDGYIRITDTTGNTLPTPFLDIDGRVSSIQQEQGLLGLAFAPDYATSGRFYVNYTNNSGNTVISRFLVDASNPNLADPGSETILTTVSQPYINHNGGCLDFGPDSMLYIGLGDGGLFDDPGNRSQDPLELLGKMLRIDVSGTGGYTVPSDNPFVGTADTLDEIWHMGLRNPWRHSFDRQTGDLWMGDVGQGDWEEINFQPAASAGGENWGWRCVEGPAPYITGGCAPSDAYDAPAFAYDHFTGGLSVTGGFVYRGTNQFTLAGTDPNVDFAHYLLADFVTGRWWTVQHNGCTGDFEPHNLGIVGFDVSTFGEDASGEVFSANLSSGTISRIVDQCSRRHRAPLAYEFVNADDSIGLVGRPEGNYIWFNSYSGCDTVLSTTEPMIAMPAFFEFNEITVEIEYPDGCKLRHTEFVPLYEGLDGTNIASEWSLSPQPAGNGLQWSVPAGNPAAVEAGRVQVLDATGRIIHTRSLETRASGFTETFDVSQWPVGLYIMHWQADAPDASGIRREASRRVVVQR